MAEGDLRAMARFIATRGGIEAGEGIDPVAAEIKAESGIDITSQHPKNVSEWFKEHFAYVITLADSARERSRVFPFTPHLLHWNLRDPTLVRVPRKTGNRPFAKSATSFEKISASFWWRPAPEPNVSRNSYLWLQSSC